ncbi:hypothetical protein AC249_AIPGENE7990 [Exaiptasia diaphana]|nr:hypothetical protein AC249_AIPGENE7990 [Exaiptasia diaphana]
MAKICNIEFESFPIDKLEDYFTIIYALENNLAEYKKIKDEVIECIYVVSCFEVYGEVCDLQDKAKKEGILKDGGDSGERASTQGLHTTGGDIISNLMEMESAGRSLDSHKDNLATMLKEGAKLVSQSSPRDR